MSHRTNSADHAPTGRADLLARSLGTAILAGSNPVGTRLPTDADLAAANGLGVATVRAALHRLELLGLIARSRGDGALVTSGEVRALYRITAEASGGGYVAETAVVVDRRRVVRSDAELAVFLDGREGAEWLHLTGLRRPADPSFGPLSWTDAWLGNVAAVVPDTFAMTVDTLEAVLGSTVAEVHEDISAAPLTPAQARQLRARGGEGSLQIARHYFAADGTLVAAVRDVHPSGRVSVIVHARRGVAA